MWVAQLLCALACGESRTSPAMGTLLLQAAHPSTTVLLTANLTSNSTMNATWKPPLDCLLDSSSAFCKDDMKFAPHPDTLKIVEELVTYPDVVPPASRIAAPQKATVAVPTSDTIWPRNMVSGTPPKKEFVVATFGFTYPYVSVEDVFMDNMLQYCNAHNYDLYVQKLKDSRDLYEQKNLKLATIVYLLKLNYKYVFWTDMDSLVINMSMPLDALGGTGSTDLVAASDANLFISTEHMLWKNTAWSMELLNKCIYQEPQPATSSGHFTQSSTCLAYMLGGEKEECRHKLTSTCMKEFDITNKKVKLLPQHSLNAQLNDFEAGDFMLSFAGLPMRWKRPIMQHFSKNSSFGIGMSFMPSQLLNKM